MEKWAKRGLLAFILIACFVLIAGCGQSSPTGLSLTGTVKHDFYSSLMGSMYSSSSMDEYAVEIIVTNQGSPVTYDAVQIYYDGGDGRGLSVLRIITSETDELEEIKLNAGQTDKFLTHSNGYTINILQHSKTGKVALHVNFLNKGEVIDSFHAVLPTIIEWDKKPAELPLWKEAPLRFTRDYDAVMKEVQKT